MAGLKNITCFGVNMSNQTLKDNPITKFQWKNLFFNYTLDSEGDWGDAFGGRSLYNLSARSGTSITKTAAVYGLRTEGYRIASSIATKGLKVSLIDEPARMAIMLKPDIARTYPNVSSLIEDEPLLALEPIDVAISEVTRYFWHQESVRFGNR